MEMSEVMYIRNDMKIDKWMDDRGITANGTLMGQAIKTLEETTELLDAINHNDDDALVDAIGDIYVTLRGVCKVKGISFDKCVQTAYNEIKDRRGHLSAGGTFVKES
jgi:uncharacterized protein YabN with tetrapyrrole methylase and pyrophosphatase domain